MYIYVYLYTYIYVCVFGFAVCPDPFWMETWWRSHGNVIGIRLRPP